MIKYNCQKASPIPFFSILDFPSIPRINKQRFQSKACKKMIVSKTDLGNKNCQISDFVRQKVADLLTDKVALTEITQRLRISTSTVYRKLDLFSFKENYEKLLKS